MLKLFHLEVIIEGIIDDGDAALVEEVLARNL
jgi:hypothetical protein